jgi:hypothetical protein
VIGDKADRPFNFMNLQFLIETLEISVAKNGDKTPLTIGHLLNICKMAEKRKEKLEFLEHEHHFSILKDIDPMGQEGLF